MVRTTILELKPAIALVCLLNILGESLVWMYSSYPLCICEWMSDFVSDYTLGGAPGYLVMCMYACIIGCMSVWIYFCMSVWISSWCRFVYLFAVWLNMLYIWLDIWVECLGGRQLVCLVGYLIRCLVGGLDGYIPEYCCIVVSLYDYLIFSLYVWLGD